MTCTSNYFCSHNTVYAVIYGKGWSRKSSWDDTRFSNGSMPSGTRRARSALTCSSNIVSGSDTAGASDRFERCCKEARIPIRQNKSITAMKHGVPAADLSTDSGPLSHAASSHRVQSRTAPRKARSVCPRSSTSTRHAEQSARWALSSASASPSMHRAIRPASRCLFIDSVPF
jgi:hypothetical protein